MNKSQIMKTQKEFELAVSSQQAEIVNNYDDNELRVKCKENGLKCGPIPTPAVRKSWAKRLAKKMVENEMSQVEDSSSGEDYQESEGETRPEFTEIPENDTVEDENAQGDATQEKLKAQMVGGQSMDRNVGDGSEHVEVAESSSSWLTYVFVFFIVSAFSAYYVQQYSLLV
jgi:hypothetical protein